MTASRAERKPPFEIGGATMGYGLGPAANGAFDGGGIGEKMRERRDGDRWFNRSMERARRQV